MAKLTKTQEEALKAIKETRDTGRGNLEGWFWCPTYNNGHSISPATLRSLAAAGLIEMKTNGVYSYRTSRGGRLHFTYDLAARPTA